MLIKKKRWGKMPPPTTVGKTILLHVGLIKKMKYVITIIKCNGVMGQSESDVLVRTLT